MAGYLSRGCHCGGLQDSEGAAVGKVPVMSPLPQVLFPPATLTLGQITAVIKIELVWGEEGEAKERLGPRRPPDARWP